jgi:NADH-quinone oxidoreductase subunit L
VNTQAASLLGLIPLLPLVGAAWNGFFGNALRRRFGNRPVSAVACGTVLLAFLLSLAVFAQLLSAESRQMELRLWSWFQSGDLGIEFAYRVDPLGAVMLLVVTGVSFLIHVYSTGYMREDAGYARYFAYLNLFVWAMLTLVLGANLFVLFIGWEGVGLCSYLLIGFWFTDVQKAVAGMKAFIVNRIGDLGFLVGGLALFWGLQRHGVPSLDFAAMRDTLPMLAGDRIFGMHLPTFVALCFFVGATGKSAQIPLYVWLPDAMAGPTPVSALIHAATMVTAGVYMIGRLSFLYNLAPAALAVVAAIGAGTALFAATIGLVQHDIKKVLAYSTVSQLGIMFLGMGVGAYAAGIFHLVTHAFFKACLFLAAGSVIQALHHEQDIRRMGGLRDKLPRTYRTFALAALALAGIPPLAGFFSKDEILWRAWSSPLGNPVLWFLGLLTALLTAFYIGRLVFLVFWGPSRIDPHLRVHESPASMTVPLVVLAALAVFGGWIGIPAALGGGQRFEHFLAPVFETAHATDASHAAAQHGTAGALEYVLMLASVAVAVAGIALSHHLYVRRPELPGELAARFAAIYRTLLNKYWVDELYTATVVRGTEALSRALARFDARVIDGMVNGTAAVTRAVSWFGGLHDRWVVDGAVNAVGWSVRAAGAQARRMQTGVVQSYVLVVFVGVAALVALLHWLS